MWKDRLVQQYDLLAALLQMHGNRYTDHPGTKNHHIGLHPGQFTPHDRLDTVSAAASG